MFLSLQIGSLRWLHGTEDMELGTAMLENNLCSECRPMSELDIIKIVCGANAVIAKFGKWPTFHDAELLEVCLRRDGSSWIDIHTWTTSGAVDDAGRFVKENEVVVRFTLDNISNLAINEFNHQNVVASIQLLFHFEDFELRINPCFGLSGSIFAKEIGVQLKPTSLVDIQNG